MRAKPDGGCQELERTRLADRPASGDGRGGKTYKDRASQLSLNPSSSSEEEHSLPGDLEADVDAFCMPRTRRESGLEGTGGGTRSHTRCEREEKGALSCKCTLLLEKKTTRPTDGSSNHAGLKAGDARRTRLPIVRMASPPLPTSRFKGRAPVFSSLSSLPQQLPFLAQPFPGRSLERPPPRPHRPRRSPTPSSCVRSLAPSLAVEARD